MTGQQKLLTINFSYVTFSPTYFLHLTYKLVYINAQWWPKVTTDVCKRNRPFTVYGSIEKTLLDHWCVFVTINWIKRSFKWIMGTNRQQHMNWTAFWWQSQRVHDRRSRPNLWQSGRKLSITRPIVRQSMPQEYNYEMENAAAFWTKNLIFAFILCQKFIKNHKSLITTVLLTAFYAFLLRLPYINIHNHMSRSLKIQPKGKNSNKITQ